MSCRWMYCQVSEFGFQFRQAEKTANALAFAVFGGCVKSRPQSCRSFGALFCFGSPASCSVAKNEKMPILYGSGFFSYPLFLRGGAPPPNACIEKKKAVLDICRGGLPKGLRFHDIGMDGRSVRGVKDMDAGAMPFRDWKLDQQVRGRGRLGGIFSRRDVTCHGIPRSYRHASAERRLPWIRTP